jgi:repressor LexA
MNRSGINDGALLLVKQQPSASEGEVVIALIDDEATLKHFHRDSEMVVLKPNSTDRIHKPIVLTDDFAVQGVVVAVLAGDLI